MARWFRLWARRSSQAVSAAGKPTGNGEPPRPTPGPLFHAAACTPFQGWLKENEVRTLYIEPGSPWQNGLLGDGLACGVFLGARVCHRPVEREACEESIRTRLR